MPPAFHRHLCAAWLVFTGMAQAAPFGTALAIADAALPSWNSGNRIATELTLVYSGAQTPAGLAVLATQLDRLTYHSPAGAASVVDADLRGGCALAATDIDSDGDADLVAASRWRREIVLYPNQGNGDFGARQTVATGVDAAIALVATRIDGDSVNDLLVLTDFDGRLFWLRGQNGGFESTPRLLHQTVGSPAAVAAGDLDADGDTDVVLLRGGTITNLLNQGNGTFLPGQTLDLNAAGILLARFDGDVLPDLAARLEPNGETRIFRNPGQGAWATAIASLLACRNLTAGDLDGDGDLDLLAGRHPDRAVVWLENRGNLEFGPAQNASTAALSICLLGDDDGDGDPELFAADRATATVSRQQGFGAQPYDRWAADFGTAVGGPAEDDNADGWPNLVAFAFGFDPRNPASVLDSGSNSTGLPVLLPHAAGLSFEFVRRQPSAASRIAYQAETSADLIHWTPVAADRLTTVALDATWERVRLTLAEPAAVARFARVRLIYPSP